MPFGSSQSPAPGSPQVPPSPLGLQLKLAISTQVVSQMVVQQNGSASHTVAQQIGSWQLGVEFPVKHGPAAVAPQSPEHSESAVIAQELSHVPQQNESKLHTSWQQVVSVQPGPPWPSRQSPSSEGQLSFACAMTWLDIPRGMMSHVMIVSRRAGEKSLTKVGIGGVHIPKITFQAKMRLFRVSYLSIRL